MRKQVLVSVDRGETRVAILEGRGTASKTAGNDTRSESNGRGRGRGNARERPAEADSGWRVAELYIERRGRKSIVGNIYKGQVDNVLSGMEAAFVDIGLEKN